MDARFHGHDRIRSPQRSCVNLIMSSKTDYSIPGNTVINKIIAAAISLRYSLTEPAQLRLARKNNEGHYTNKNDQPLISLVIPTYNRGKILTERTIPSILAQTYQNFEIVVVGDHCIDNTEEMLRRITDHRVRFFDLHCRSKYPRHFASRWFVQGVPPRNKGLELVRGLWLSWISDDDILLPHHFETLLHFAQQGNYEFISAAYTYEKKGKVLLQDGTGENPRIGGMQTWLYRSYLKLFKWNINSWRKYWDRPCDYDLQFRMHKAGVRMGFINKVVAYVPSTEGTDTVGYEAQKLTAGTDDLKYAK
jgi:hypothetical protein